MLEESLHDKDIIVCNNVTRALSDLFSNSKGVDSLLTSEIGFDKSISLFLEASLLSQTSKKNTISIFSSIASSRLNNKFRIINDVAEEFANNSFTDPYISLVDGLDNHSDENQAIEILKFLN